MTCPIYVPGEQGKGVSVAMAAGNTAVKWQSQAAQIKDPIKHTQIIKTLRDI